MLKKVICAILSCSMIFSVAGCGTNNNSTNNNSAIESTNETTPVANTKFGKVSGTVKDNVVTYYGVPYGKNPVDDLRWSYPTDPDAWEDVRDCSKEQEIALQMKSTFGDDGTPTVALEGTTDCLNLDIYTKSDSKNLPVIVYVHGGNNQTGTSLEVGGHDLVSKEDVVYVSINYRLGLLGFNPLPAVLDENESGNFGLMDIKKSLEWVRENIAEFGGNPDNITLTGFSAGGRDVMATLISPEFEGLYDKAVVYSGGMTIANLENSQKKVAEIMSPLVIEDGICKTEDEAINYLLQDTDEVTSYLMGLKEDRIISLLSDAGIRMSKFPHLFGDDITLPSTGFENATYVQDVPIIMLTGTDEFSLFTTFDAIYKDFGDEGDSAKKFAIKYGSDFYRIFNTQLSAEKMINNYNSDIYLCEVEYGGENSDNKIGMVGSFHGVFVPMLTDTHGYASFHDYKNDTYQSMSDAFRKYLVNFVNTGNPNGDGLVEWDNWTLDNKNTLLFDGKDGEAFIESSDMYKTNEDIIDEMMADTSVSANLKSVIISQILNGRWFSESIDEYFGNNNGW